MAKMSVFTPMINEIQQKYKTTRKNAGGNGQVPAGVCYSPTAGCLPMLVNMLVLFGMVEVVYRPVQYILSIPKDAIAPPAPHLALPPTAQRPRPA